MKKKKNRKLLSEILVIFVLETTTNFDLIAAITQMGTNVKRRHSDMPHFNSVARISNLPIIEYSINVAGNAYAKIKVSKAVLITSFTNLRHFLSSFTR